MNVIGLFMSCKGKKTNPVILFYFEGLVFLCVSAICYRDGVQTLLIPSWSSSLCTVFFFMYVSLCIISTLFFLTSNVKKGVDFFNIVLNCSIFCVEIKKKTNFSNFYAARVLAYGLRLCISPSRERNFTSVNYHCFLAILKINACNTDERIKNLR